MASEFKKSLSEAESELAIAKVRIAELEARLAAAKTLDIQQNQSLQRLVQRLDGLHQLDHAMLSAETVENVAQIALTHVIDLIPCARASIATINLAAKTVYILALYSQTSTSIPGGQTYSIDDTYVPAIVNQAYTIIDNLDQSPNAGVRQLYSEGIRTILMIPLRMEDNLVGLLTLHSVQTNGFTEENVQIAKEVANQIAISIHKATLSDRLARYAQRMEILHTIDLGLIQGGSVKELINKTFKQLQRLIPCERIGVGLIEPATQEVIIYTAQFDNESELRDGFRIPIPPNWFDGFNADGTRVLNNLHLLDDPTYKRMASEGFQSQLQVLLHSHTNNIGVMGFSSRTLDFFTPEHQEVGAEVANQLAIALNQMQLSEALARHAEELEQRVVERTAELQKSKDQIEAILHNSLDGILLIDQDLRIQQANPAVSRLLSIEPDQRETVNLLDLIHPDDANRVKSVVEQAIAEGDISPVEVQTRHKNGDKVDMEMTFGYIRGDGLVSTIHDITARKQTEEALKEALAKEKELVDARSRFVSVTSHEFRTPLTVILSAVEMLLTYRERLDNANIERKLNMIRQNTLHMRSIMDDVLQLMKIQSGYLDFRFEQCDFDALCRNILQDFEDIAEAKGRLIYTSSASPVNTICDQRLMKLVINNLVSNGVKYSPSDKPVEVHLSHDSTNVYLSVHDQGIGIPSQDLGRLFEPFHRASNVDNRQGTGLGLSITKQIAEGHGGQIHFKSQVGEGSTFTVSMPLIDTLKA
jgi:PAS domain S-box-containing protein